MMGVASDPEIWRSVDLIGHQHMAGIVLNGFRKKIG
jgi:hypothetical protein